MMGYSASVYAGQRTRRANNYRGVKRGIIRGTFIAIFRLVSLSLILAFSIGFVIFMSIILLYGYNRAIKSDYFSLKEIEISGNRQLTYAQLSELMNVNPGDNLLQLKISDLAGRLDSNPWIEEVSVKRVFPDRLVVNLKEKQAYFWMQDKDRLCYADEKGQLITDVSPGRYVSLPFLYIDVDHYDHDVQSIAGFLQNRTLPFSFQDISWIRARQSGAVEIRLDSHNLNIELERTVFKAGPGRLRSVWMDLERRNELSAAKRIIIAGNNAWVGYE